MPIAKHAAKTAPTMASAEGIIPKPSSVAAFSNPAAAKNKVAAQNARPTNGMQNVQSDKRAHATAALANPFDGALAGIVTCIAFVL